MKMKDIKETFLENLFQKAEVLKNLIDVQL